MSTNIDALCEVMHNAYENAAAGMGWETQEVSRVAWADLPVANKQTMRAAVQALLHAVADGAHVEQRVYPDGERGVPVSALMHPLTLLRDSSAPLILPLADEQEKP